MQLFKPFWYNFRMDQSMVLKERYALKQKFRYNYYFRFSDQPWHHGASVNCDVMSGQHYYWAPPAYFVRFYLSVIPFSIYFGTSIGLLTNAKVTLDGSAYKVNKCGFFTK